MSQEFKKRSLVTNHFSFRKVDFILHYKLFEQNFEVAFSLSDLECGVRCFLMLGFQGELQLAVSSFTFE